MSLKRKASFTTITSPCPNSSRHSSVSQSQFLAGHLVTIEETPRHLHSRTRKRFRPDRRDEQTIYDKTIRWLFAAQKQLKNHDISLPSTDDNDVSDEGKQIPSLPAVPDRTQQTLRKFFQPISRTRLPTAASGSMGDEGDQQRDQSFAAHSASPAMSSSSCSTFSNFNAGPSDMDLDMSIDVDSPPSDSSASNTPLDSRWISGTGWM